MLGPDAEHTQNVNLSVVGPKGETGISPPPPPPAGSESGLVSSFDDAKPTASYGAWSVATDSWLGGKSTASMQVVEGGANGSKGALRVTGELVPGAQFFTFAGVLFAPASTPAEAANLSGKKEIAFWAKGDGQTYTVLVMTEKSEGQMP